jgi:hypothetical protein
MRANKRIENKTDVLDTVLIIDTADKKRTVIFTVPLVAGIVPPESRERRILGEQLVQATQRIPLVVVVSEDPQERFPHRVRLLLSQKAIDKTIF